MADKEPEWVYQIGKLQLAPDDIVILRTEMKLTADQGIELRKRAQEVLGKDVKILVISSGLDIKILTKKEAESVGISHMRFSGG
jgi:hypothetical protein